MVDIDVIFVMTKQLKEVIMSKWTSTIYGAHNQYMNGLIDVNISSYNNTEYCITLKGKIFNDKFTSISSAMKFVDELILKEIKMELKRYE